jgi:hypothetical protein
MHERAGTRMDGLKDFSTLKGTPIITFILILRKVLNYLHSIVSYFQSLYRMSQEERSIFLEVIVSVILRKKVYMNMCPIPVSDIWRAVF